MRTPTCGSRHRGGFTLVELLVVMSLFIVLATMAVLVVPGLKDKQGVSRAADQFQGWLLIAKQRAVRDQAPRGIRILPDLNGAFTVVQYIEQPEDYMPIGTLRVSPDANDTTPFLTTTRTLNTAPAGFAIETGLVNVGDWIQLTDSNTRQTYRIAALNPPAPLNATSIALSSNVQSAENYRLLRSGETPKPALSAMSRFDFVNSATTKQFRIVRGMKPMSGEATQQLPVSVVLNIRNNIPPLPAVATQPPSSTPGLSDAQFAAGVPFDIVFMPSGQLKDSTSGQIILRIDPAAGVGGASSLIVIYARTGAIVSHPVADGADPFQFVRDGQDSGL